MAMKGQFIRLDAREGYRDKIDALTMNPDYTFMFGMAHRGGTGENPHQHLVIATEVAMQAFRVRFKKIFTEGKGNGHMAIKAWDGDMDACSQQFHEPNAEIIVTKNVSAVQLEEFRQRNQHVQAEVAQAKEKAAWTIEQEALVRLAGRDQRELTDLAIYRVIVQVAFDKNKQVPNKFLARSMMHNIRYKLCNGVVDDQETVVYMIASSYLE